MGLMLVVTSSRQQLLGSNQVLSDRINPELINPDLTLSERQTNCKARDITRGRRGNGLENAA